MELGERRVWLWVGRHGEIEKLKDDKWSCWAVDGGG